MKNLKHCIWPVYQLTLANNLASNPKIGEIKTIKQTKQKYNQWYNSWNLEGQISST